MPGVYIHTHTYPPTAPLVSHPSSMWFSACPKPSGAAYPHPCWQSPFSYSRANSSPFQHLHRSGILEPVRFTREHWYLQVKSGQRVRAALPPLGISAPPSVPALCAHTSHRYSNVTRALRHCDPLAREQNLHLPVLEAAARSVNACSRSDRWPHQGERPEPVAQQSP